MNQWSMQYQSEKDKQSNDRNGSRSTAQPNQGHRDTMKNEFNETRKVKRP